MAWGMTRLTVVAAAALASLAAAQGPYWWKYPGYDCPSMDISHDTGGLAKYETDCAADNGCAGFNGNGWLKDSKCSESTMQSGQGTDLYLKKATPQPTPPPPPKISLWPIPVSMTSGASNVTVSPQLTFTATTPSADLTAAFARFAEVVFQHTLPAGVKVSLPASLARAAASAGPVLSAVTVTVADVTVPLQLGVDESYTLYIPADGTAAVLTANTTYGAYQGLQTLSQLVQWDFDSKTYGVNFLPMSIVDEPRFAWRGLLIDTDRHFLPLTTIFRVIDSITYAKMNTLHWHIVDWQSWPWESAAYPLLWTAAWSATERYTFEDFAAVVEYARQRGVRVVPEFDTPGHAGSICTGYPDACPSPTCTMPVNPANNITYDLINAVLTEIAALSPDNYMHLGGDEVDTTCWTDSPQITAWMAARNLTADLTYEYLVNIVDAMSLKIGKIPIRWEEVWKHFGNQLDPRTIIHAWLSTDAVVNCTSEGYRAIWSVDGIYYLDALNEPWQPFYDADVLQDITNETAKQYVLGGEVEMWGETADPSDVLQTIWPRAAAAAERWWSYNVATNSTDPSVADRLQDFRCMLHTRGIPAAPVTNAAARTAPSGPGSCKYQ